MAGQTFTVGQKVWTPIWVDDERHYRECTVTSVSKSGAKVCVSYSDGDVASYFKAAQSQLYLDDDVRRFRERDLAARARQDLRDSINDARDRYDDTIARLWMVVRGDGSHNPEFLQRLQKTTKQLEAIILSLATPVATDQQEPSR